MTLDINPAMIERAQAHNPNGRPLTVHLAVHVWTDQSRTNAALAVDCLFLNHGKDFGIYWMGSKIKQIDDPQNRQVQRSLFSEDDE
jgi:hypothetical protein